MGISSVVKVGHLGKPDRNRPFHHERYGVDRPTDDEKNEGATKDNLGDCKENVRTTTDSEEHDKTIEYPEMATSSDEDASDSEEGAGMSTDSEDDSCYNPPDIANTAMILEDSSHRDGSIYKGNSGWKRTYRIADLDDTRLEAMMLSGPKYCILDGETCVRHYPCPMLHFFSLKLAEIAVTGGPVELYGYLAARDLLDPLRNYIFHTSRDDPIIVEKGSLIEISGPKRGIEILSDVLIEFDMRIKTGAEQDDDRQLIDGVLVIGCLETPIDVTLRRCIYGDCGAVEIKFSHLQHAVEATVQVAILEVQSHFNLSIGSYVGSLPEEMQLFRGHIVEPCGLRKFVLAAMMRNLLRLKLKVSQGGSYAEHFCSFEANHHGHSCQQINTEFASFLVKVTWSTLDFGNPQSYL